MHRRPQIVSAKPQQQLEDLFIYFRTNFPGLLVKGLLDPLRPASEALVIYEYSSVLHVRLFLQEASGLHIQRLLARRSHVSPPVPRRDSGRLTERCETESRSAAVASGDHQQRTSVSMDGLYHVRLPFAGQGVGVDQPFGSKAINQT